MREIKNSKWMDCDLQIQYLTLKKILSHTVYVVIGLTLDLYRIFF